MAPYSKYLPPTEIDLLYTAKKNLNLASMWRVDPALPFGPDTAAACAAIAQAAALVSIAESLQILAQAKGKADGTP